MPRFGRVFTPVSLLIATTIAVGMASHAFAAKPRFESAYTDLEKDCRDDSSASGIEEGQDMPKRCRGPGGLSVVVWYSASTSAMQVKAANGADAHSQPLASTLTGFDRGKVEWRMADGHPFALIVRVGAFEGRPAALEVRGVGRFRALSGRVPTAGHPQANAEARTLAERGYTAAR